MSVQAYADEYFELLEAFPQELQRTATRVRRRRRGARVIRVRKESGGGRRERERRSVRIFGGALGLTSTARDAACARERYRESAEKERERTEENGTRTVQEIATGRLDARGEACGRSGRSMRTLGAKHADVRGDACGRPSLSVVPPSHPPAPPTLFFVLRGPHSGWLPSCS